MQAITRGRSITCHSWNSDGTRVAICPNDNRVLIVCKDNGAQGGWRLEHTLTEHDSIVTGIDWAPRTNRIVTCSQDRNAHVWQWDEGSKTWKPTLVILRINRCATSVRWSPNEDKFAVGSGAKCVSVCHFEEDNDWWVSKHLKRHRSTVTKVAWHPNNQLLATASTDFKCRIFNCAIREVDKRPTPTPWGTKKPFDEPIWEFNCGGWVEGLCFSPSGNRLCYVGHDSTVNFVDAPGDGGAAPEVFTLKLKLLPMCDVMFLAEDKVTVVGFDCAPYLVAQTGRGWELVKCLDEKPKAGASAPAAGATRAAFNMFQDKATRGTTDTEKLSTSVETKHQNTITCVRAYKYTPSSVSEFTTSALDGDIQWWK